VFKQEKMDDASILLFLNNYFMKIHRMFSKCFSTEVILSGWRRAGIRSFSIPQLQNSCPPVFDLLRKLDEESAANLIDAVKRLGTILATSNKGYFDDEEIKSELDAFGLTTPIKNMTERCFNQQRAMWLNQQGVIQLRRERIQKKLEEEAKTREAAAAREMKK
jgi:hypothetical protein